MTFIRTPVIPSVRMECGRRPNESRGVSNFAIQGPGGESRQFLSDGPVNAHHQGMITHTPKPLITCQYIIQPSIMDIPNSFRLATTRINGSTAPASKWRQSPAAELIMHRPYHRDLEFPRSGQKLQRAPKSSLCL
jgi:hypothetical protein